MDQAGWRSVFVIFGAASLLWLGPWLLRTRHASRQADIADLGPTPTYLEMLRHREAWGACLGHFAANYGFYFVISWLPLYLVKARGFTVPQMAEIGGGVYLAYAASAALSGWLTDRWMIAGASANRARKTVAATCQVAVALCLAACAFGDRTASVVSLLAAGLAMGINSAGIWAIGQTLAGARAAGKWIGFQNAIGNIAGIVAPLITGAVVDATGQFFWAFIIAAVMAVIGAAGWCLVIRKVEPLNWPSLEAWRVAPAE
jgi:nitrate/nitrite transporter NarK